MNNSNTHPLLNTSKSFSDDSTVSMNQDKKSHAQKNNLNSSWSTTPTTSRPSRRYRYSRSSTASVTQLLSDSCNSLLQRFRRNPSEKPEKKVNVLSSNIQR